MERARAALGIDDLQHVLGRERLEIEPVGGVVIRRDRLRVAIDHDGLVADVAQREAGVAAAIVELDALPDPVRPAAEDHHLAGLRGSRLVDRRAGEGRRIGRVHVGGGGGELGRAGIDALEDGPHAEPAPECPHIRLVLPRKHREPRIGEPRLLELPEGAGRLRQAMGADLGLQVDDALDLLQEPAVDMAALIDLVVAPAEPERLGDLEQPVGRGGAEGGLDRVVVVAAAEPLDLDLVEPGEARLERAQRLLERFLEGAPDGHGLADRLHGGGEGRLGAGEFLEGEAGDLGDDVVDGGLEGGRGRPPGDVVVDLVERVADGELGGDLGDRKARRLGGEGGGARDARVHLDHDHAPVLGIDRELHVRPTRLDADLAEHRDRGVAHDLVFLVGQRQSRGDGDRIAGMHPHRIDVLDGADDDAVIRLVADDLHLVFLPAEHALLDQHLVGGGGVEAALDDLEEFLAVIGDAPARAAEREGGADNGRQPHMREGLERLAERVFLVALAPLVLVGRPFGLELRLPALRARDLQLGEVFLAVGLLQRGGIGEGRAGRLEADLRHRVAEEGAVLGLVDGGGVRADHLDAEFVEHAHLLEREGGVERGLAAHGGQEGEAACAVAALLLDDLRDDFRGDRLDIGRVREVGIGHDRGRVRIDQHDPVALGAQRLAGLGAGIIELAGLADHDGTGPDDQDGGDVGTLGHEDSRTRPAGRAPSGTRRIGKKLGLGGPCSRGGAEGEAAREPRMPMPQASLPVRSRRIWRRTCRRTTAWLCSSSRAP